MRFLMSLVALCLLCVSAHAGEPVAIEADGALEWLRDQHIYRATGNVTITQGTTTITGDNADASYDPTGGPSSLTRITITGAVRITQSDTVIAADSATYDVAAQTVFLRGDDLRITTKMGAITADDMDYNLGTRVATARGHAVVTQTDGATKRTIEAKKIEAFLDPDNTLTRAVASGGVIMRQTAPGGVDVITAATGEYDTVKSIITLRGQVSLIQGQNRMEGDAATVNLATGQSRLSSTSKNTRVRAVFTPGDDSALPRVGADVPMVPPKKTTQDPYATKRDSL